MASKAKAPPLSQPSNGVITAPPPGVVGGNRKKQKRRAKQAAKAAEQTSMPPPPTNGQALPDQELDYGEDALRYNESYDEYSDGEGDEPQYAPNHDHAGTNGYGAPSATGKKKNKKRTSSTALTHNAYNPALLGSQLPSLPTPPPPPGSHALTHKHSANQKDLWNTSTTQERANIKSFWLSLSETERKSLLKIEKEAVLRKMKQQQKSSCSCTVCGRKRTAIEEELEVLYEGYYEELEQYAGRDQPPLAALETHPGMMPDPLMQRRLPHPLAAPPPASYAHRQSAMHEHLEEDSFSEDEEDEEYSDDEDEEEEFSDEEPLPPHNHHHHHPYPAHNHAHGHSMVTPPVPDFFNFGQNLTVKGILTPWIEKLQSVSSLSGHTDNLLTVADDLLKNDGRKFIEMMEQLAERRMQRESEAEYQAANGPMHAPHAPHGGHHHAPHGAHGAGPGGMPGGYPPEPGQYPEDPLAADGDEFDDEASYDSQEEYEDDLEEEDEMVSSDSITDMSFAVLSSYRAV